MSYTALVSKLTPSEMDFVRQEFRQGDCETYPARLRHVVSWVTDDDAKTLWAQFQVDADGRNA